VNGQQYAEILDFWNREIVKVLNDSKVKAEFLKHGLDSAPGSRDDLAHYMAREFPRESPRNHGCGPSYPSMTIRSIVDTGSRSLIAR
jgi:hypothetical protein